jgi:hypothetical protein
LLLFAGSALAADFLAAPLTGGDEVPANNTKARGNAGFSVSEDRSQIDYKLIVANIDNAFMAHIHIGAVGTNGPIVAFLFGPIAPGGGTLNGLIAEGTITAANLIGPLEGHPLSDLLSAMQAGNAYVNVHTNDGVAPANTGPGDFPGGEIRSQIRPAD